MGDNEDILSFFEEGFDSGLIIGDDAISRVSQAFTSGRSDGITSAPGRDLFFAIFFSYFRLVEPLETAIVAFVQRPVACYRQIGITCRFEDIGHEFVAAW